MTIYIYLVYFISFRYSGPHRQRIFTSNNQCGNVLHGFWSYRRGVFHENGWITANDLGKTFDWLVACYSSGERSPQNFYADGVAVGDNYGPVSLPAPCTMTINGYVHEQSDFKFLEMVIWDKALTSTDLKKVSQKMLEKINPGYKPPIMIEGLRSKKAVEYAEVSGVPTWGVYRAGDYDKEKGILKEATGNGRDAVASGTGVIEKKFSDVKAKDQISFEILAGNVRSKLSWPSGSIPRVARTFCHIVR